MDLLSQLSELLTPDVFDNLIDSADYELYTYNGSDIVWLLSLLEPYERDRLYKWYLLYESIPRDKFDRQIDFYIWLSQSYNLTYTYSWYNSLTYNQQNGLKQSFNSIQFV